MQLFRTTGQKFFHSPGAKGQRSKLKILPRDGPGSQNSGWDGPGQPKSGTGRGTKRERAEKDVLKQENDVVKQKTLSRDKGTPGQEFFFVPETKGQEDVPSCPLETLLKIRELK